MAIGHDLSRTRSRGSNSIIRMVYDDNILQIILQIRETEIRNSLKFLFRSHFFHYVCAFTSDQRVYRFD